jgi:hypothetical protein
MSDFKPIRHRFIPEPELSGTTLMVRWNYKGHDVMPDRRSFLQDEWNNTLVTKINECRNWLHTTYNEDDIFNFNTVTSSPSAIMIFDSMPHFLIQQHSEMTNPRHIGILGGRYVVGMDSDITDDKIFLGTQEQPMLACIIIDNLGL